MKKTGSAVPPWLLALDLLAVLLLAAGIVRLYVPDLAPLNALPEAFAWAFVTLGLATLALFWVFLIGNLRGRRAAK